jgi:hypothetical protein
MRLVQLAFIAAAALALQACSSAPAREVSAQEQIVNSIMGAGKRRNSTDMQCPSNLTRYCSGVGTSMTCGCMNTATLRQYMGGNY